MRLTTARLVIREMTVADAAFILKLMTEPGWLQFIGNTSVRTLDDAVHHILTRLTSTLGLGFRVVELDDSMPIGICGLVQRDYLDHVDLGYAFLEAYWHQGYAVEAATAMLDYALHTRGFKQLCAITDLGNVASIRVLERLGFRYERDITVPKDGTVLKLFRLDVGGL